MRKKAGPKRFARSWLLARVHFDAFRSAPKVYLVACWWWTFRRRVRARAMIEPLLGASPHAYSLWRARHEYAAAREGQSAPSSAVRIVIGLDLSEGESGSDITLESLDRTHASIDVMKLGKVGLAAQTMPELPFWIIPVAPGDRVAPDAIAVYSAAAEGTQQSILYADDDVCDEQGLRDRPHFKPSWNSELFQWHDYLSYACMIRIDDPSELAALTDREDWVRQLIDRRLAASPGQVGHVKRLLHHRRRPSKPKLPLNASHVGEEILPPVTVIVPTRNRVELLRTCMAGLAETDYPLLDVIVIDNDSDDPHTLDYLKEIEGPKCRVLKYEGPFNYAAMNNAAVSLATGELVCFLNNDIEMLDVDWLIHLARQAINPTTGAVGARLLYADGSIQHAGVVIGVGGGAAHAHRYLRPEDEGYFSRHNLPQSVTAVTAACLLVRRAYFQAVGGFDEKRFPVAFNDVDLCLKLNERGWQSFYEPRATLIHHESKSRGKDSHRSNRRRFAAELAALKERWQTETTIDPYHHPSLSRYSEQFVLRT
ncbi:MULTISPECIES: glycosyltransferase family 2 protein [unclassified Sphingobium]|uniref:glycosyltransferase family 2 protein n=1 Tax=unclassified Sphingobium TaxID=2611147 RepID=UPI0022246D93|nr:MULTISPECIES: glycosyltransferase family 2 protein [unclassified Sphingobium]MCW2411760.1 GT2 family glycosyltransferase [Sphingobium sp. B8D3D]MCW2415944.1 GT2 family glycosyltransferase [Sphingobium sp. B8D3A]